MSQSKVKDYFNLRKANRDLQPSKRRKLDLGLGSGDEEVPVLSKIRPAGGAQVQEFWTSDKNKESVKMNNKSGNIGNLAFSGSAEVESGASKSMFSAEQPKSESRSSRVQASKSRSGIGKGRKPKSIPPTKGQQKLDFKPAKVVTDPSPAKETNSLDTTANSSEVELEKEQHTEVEVTSVWDDHMNQECTPRKRIMSEMESLSQGPKARVRKSAARKLKQQEDHDQLESLDLQDVKFKKKLELDDGKAEKVCSAKTEASCSSVADGSSPKLKLLDLVTEMSEVQGAISPLASTPEHLKSQDPTPATLTPKLHNLSEKLKRLSRMDGQALKNRLKQKGMLGEVKEKVQDLSKATAESKAITITPTPTSAEPVLDEKSEEKLPAYQRYEYLVKEGLPTLSLPYTYRLLENAFQAMDTVVSMLHNRAEVCTFNKLQASVQNVTKKNFPQKTAGQIKTVVPDAFNFRQEKVPVYGQRASPYVLTIEANLKEEDDGGKKNMTKGGKIPFTASVLLRRKTQFKASLLRILKKHHRTFLESLNPPLRVPDDKLSRWHPKFALEKVPDIATSDFPQPPNLQVYRTAKDVLEQVGKLNPRIQKALSKVVAESGDANKNTSQQQEAVSKVNNTKESPSQPIGSSSSPSSQPSPTQSSLKGIPPALLAKIRAKEALKMEQAMTRDPAEDRKMRMLGHLPEMIRILRSYFVTEKKPALPLGSVIKKLGDSYHTGMSQGDIEQHIKLLKETAPEFLSIVEIKRGKFVKLDKNVDITTLSDRINNVVKASK